MTFSEAMEHMKKGCVIRRPCWEKKFGMTLYRGELWYVLKGSLNSQVHLLDERNVIAEDWEVLI